MVCQTLRTALLIGAITAVAVSPARANHNRGNGGCCDNPGPAPCGPTAPATRTIQVTECVPEYYTVKRTAYRTECRTETYDTVRTECVPEWREKVCTVVRKVPVITEQCRKVCRTVTCYEDRTVMKTCYKYVQVTCMKKELVRRGHWECRTECVPARRHGLFGGNGGGLFGGHHKSACNDPCADPCAQPCPEYTVRTRKVWVNCPEYRECPVTVCKKVCVQVPQVCRVPVCKTVWSEEKVKVCTYKCVEDRQVQKYCVMVPRQVPCKATRTVRVCVPYEVEQKCCRMVARTVCRQVPACPTQCAPACPTTSCCEATVCCQPAKKRCGGLLGGLFGGNGHGSRNSSCCR